MMQSSSLRGNSMRGPSRLYKLPESMYSGHNEMVDEKSSSVFLSDPLSTLTENHLPLSLDIQWLAWRSHSGGAFILGGPFDSIESASKGKANVSQKKMKFSLQMEQLQRAVIEFDYIGTSSSAMTIFLLLCDQAVRSRFFKNESKDIRQLHNYSKKVDFIFIHWLKEIVL